MMLLVFLGARRNLYLLFSVLFSNPTNVDIGQMPEEDRAHKPLGPDAKERFFWRIGELPKETEFPSLNAAPVVPKAFPEW